MLPVRSIGQGATIEPLCCNSFTIALNPIPLWTTRFVVLEEVLIKGKNNRETNPASRMAEAVIKLCRRDFFWGAIDTYLKMGTRSTWMVIRLTFFPLMLKNTGLFYYGAVDFFECMDLQRGVGMTQDIV